MPKYRIKTTVLTRRTYIMDLSSSELAWTAHYAQGLPQLLDQAELQETHPLAEDLTSVQEIEEVT